MATTASLLFPFPHKWRLAPPPLVTRPRSRFISLSIAKSKPEHREEDIVIVGAGIAGLATAVALQRLGIGSLVLEQGESLRTGGTSLTLFKNGWKILDAIGVATQLRSQFLEIRGVAAKSKDGRVLRTFRYKEEDESQEVRGVERGILLETLASKLPPDAISFSSKLKGIETLENGITTLNLEDGSQISAKIVIACDGIRSPVAKWMGFSDARFVGHCAIRGLASYPDGQPYEPEVAYIYGQGVRAAYVPVSATKVYWFVVFNKSLPVPKPEDPSILRREAEGLLQGWPSDLLNVIKRTPDDTLIRSALVDRWLWPGISPPASKGKVVLVGDAWHPMTPNLGQGACCALEDAIILAKKLAEAINNSSFTVEQAFTSYESERWPRIFPLSIRANLMGAVLQLDNSMLCSFRDNIVVPKLVRVGQMLEHTNFEFEPLT